MRLSPLYSERDRLAADRQVHSGLGLEFEIVPLAELKTRLLAKLMPLVQESQSTLAELAAGVGGKLVLGTLVTGDSLGASAALAS